jgi:hypothetical protein
VSAVHVHDSYVILDESIFGFGIVNTITAPLMSLIATVHHGLSPPMHVYGTELRSWHVTWDKDGGFKCDSHAMIALWVSPITA